MRGCQRREYAGWPCQIARRNTEPLGNCGYHRVAGSGGEQFAAGEGVVESMWRLPSARTVEFGGESPLRGTAPAVKSSRDVALPRFG